MDNTVKRHCRYCNKIYDEKPNIPRYARVCKSCREKGLKGKLSVEQKRKRLKKLKETNQKKFGCDYPMQSKEVKDRYKQTFIKKYGVSHPAKTQAHIAKIHDTFIKKYGDHPSRIEFIKKKKKETNIKKYGVEHVFQSEKIKDKIKNTMLKKYGGFGYQSEDIKDKIEKTNLEKYGFENVSKNKEIRIKIGTSNRACDTKVKEKVKKTWLDHYGDHPSKDKNIQEKKKETNIKKYGVEHVFQSEKIKDKIKNSIMNRYGVNHYSKTNNFRHQIKLTIRNKMIPKIDEFLKENNLELCSEYNHAHDKITLKCLTCGKKFETLWNYLQQGYTCPYCFPKNISKYERELIDFLESLGLNIEKNVRNIIPPKEIDIFIPDKKIAIEFNGLYWHSEKLGCDKNYHLEKTILCSEKNIRLIHIFEDEWLNKKDIVKARLKQILGCFNGQRVHARKCIIKEINNNTKNDFLEKYHIQGKDNAKIKLGAFYNGEIVAVMTFSHGNISKGSKYIKDVWELNRFCTKFDYHIPGIASKLLTFFKRNYDWQLIFSYADRRWSNGNVYEKLGFELDSYTQPNYWYVKNNIRIHRFSLRKSVDNPNNLPEKIIREQQGYLKIWDCGNFKYILINEKYDSKIMLFE